MECLHFGIRAEMEIQNLKNLEIAINGAFSTMTQTSENHKGAKIEMKSSCVSCAPLSKDEPIEIVIKWDDKYEEKMVLKRK